MAYQPTTVVEVLAWGRTVGAVSGDRGRYEFQYTPAWKRQGIELSPLLMPASGRSSRYSFPLLNDETFHGLPPMLADALTDKFGNAIVDAWLATQGVDRSQIAALDRLAYLGGRGMGALEFVPDGGPAAPRPTALDMGELMRAARAKAVVNIDEATGDIRPGQVLPGPGEEAWLLKFDGVGKDRQLGESQQYTRIEYAYSLMARAAGIDMAPTRLLTENGRAHFLTKRFDRRAGSRIHMQSLCGLAAVDFNLRGTNDYAQLFTASRQLGLDSAALTEIFRRMAFNVAASNHDDHSKNHSFLLGEDGVWALSPAYDVTFAHDSANMWIDQHLMSVNGEFKGIARSDLLEVADRFAVPGAKRAIADVTDAIGSWAEFAGEAGLGAAVTDEVSRSFVPISQ